MTADDLIALLQQIPGDSRVEITTAHGPEEAWIDGYEGGGQLAGQIHTDGDKGWWVFLSPARE